MVKLNPVPVFGAQKIPVPCDENLSLCTAVPFLFVRRLEATHSEFLREYKIKVDGQLRRYNHSCFSFSKMATSLLNDPFSLALTSMFPLRTVRNAVRVVYSNVRPPVEPNPVHFATFPVIQSRCAKMIT